MTEKNYRKLTAVIFGEAGAGKSFLADTAPGPRLILDIEGGTRFTPSRKVIWDPRGAPPKGLEPEDSIVVPVASFKTMQEAFQWFVQGDLPVRSFVVDSLTEAQARAKDTIVGTGDMQMRDWGTLLTKVNNLVRSIRDLTIPDQGRPELDVALFVAGVQERGKDHTALRPMLEGSMTAKLAYHIDVQTFLSVSLNGEGGLERHAQFAPINGVAAKDRTGFLGVGMEDPSIPKMLDVIESGLRARDKEETA